MLSLRKAKILEVRFAALIKFIMVIGLSGDTPYALIFYILYIVLSPLFGFFYIQHGACARAIFL